MKKIFLFAILTLTFPYSIKASLLDKIVVIIDDRIVTLSEIERIKKNLNARKEIAGFVYEDIKPTNKSIIDHLIDMHIIKSEIQELGYEVSDSFIESKIDQLQSRLNLTRQDLLDFINSKNVIYEEYFEMVRMTEIFNIFNGRVIIPLVSVSDQEIKNRFFQKFSSSNTLSFKYSLVGFSIPEQVLQSKSDIDNFKKTLKTYRITGSLPDLYSELATTNFGDVSEDGLTKDIVAVLKKTDEGEFSLPILIGDRYHSFYVKNKNIVESSAFQEQKEVIRFEIIKDKAESVRKSWLRNKRNQFYINIL